MQNIDIQIRGAIGYYNLPDSTVEKLFSKGNPANWRGVEYFRKKARECKVKQLHLLYRGETVLTVFSEMGKRPEPGIENLLNMFEGEIIAIEDIR